MNRASPPVDDWELEPSEIAFQEKIASGAFGDLYKGAYCGQDVAIKIVRNVQDNTQQFQEFIQASEKLCFSLLFYPIYISCVVNPCCLHHSNFALALGILDLKAIVLWITFWPACVCASIGQTQPVLLDVPCCFHLFLLFCSMLMCRIWMHQNAVCLCCRRSPSCGRFGIKMLFNSLELAHANRTSA